MSDEFQNGYAYRLARVEQRVADLDSRVTMMIPITSNVVQLTERVETLRRDVRAYAERSSKLEEELATRERATRRERRQATIAMVTLAVMIMCALIPAATVLISSSH